MCTASDTHLFRHINIGFSINQQLNTFLVTFAAGQPEWTLSPLYVLSMDQDYEHASTFITKPVQIC